MSHSTGVSTGRQKQRSCRFSSFEKEFKPKFRPAAVGRLNIKASDIYGKSRKRPLVHRLLVLLVPSWDNPLLQELQQTVEVILQQCADQSVRDDNEILTHPFIAPCHAITCPPGARCYWLKEEKKKISSENKINPSHKKPFKCFSGCLMRFQLSLG